MLRARFSAGKATRYNYHVTLKNLPESFSGFKIAQISDLHSRPAKGISEIIKDASPDIIVITGDIFCDDDVKTEYSSPLIFELMEIAPVYFVSGNHDLWRSGYRKTFKKYEDAGGIFMDGKSEIIEKNGEKIGISGAPDPFSRVPSKISENTKNSLEQLEKIDGVNILLFHRANLFDIIKDYGFDLILAGHMHGGQIRIPGIGGLLAPTSALLSGNRMIFPKYSGGTVTDENTTMIVNRGVGNTLPLPRLGNAPEVGIITLLKE